MPTPSAIATVTALALTVMTVRIGLRSSAPTASLSATPGTPRLARSSPAMSRSSSVGSSITAPAIRPIAAQPEPASLPPERASASIARQSAAPTTPASATSRRKRELSSLLGS